MLSSTFPANQITKQHISLGMHSEYIFFELKPVMSFKCQLKYSKPTQEKQMHMKKGKKLKMK